MTEVPASALFRHPSVYPDTSDSARRIVPVLIEMIGVPSRVVDIGGGIGAWNRVFLEHGSSKAICIDSPGVDPTDLMIPPPSFVPWDLSKSFPKPVEADLAVCIEVAEHLPESQSEPLAEFLIACAPVVLFSAAIPGQPGYGHINEKPAADWKRLFAALDYERLDVIRPRILGDSEIPYWYRQNLFLYAEASVATKLSTHRIGYQSIPDDFELVHQRMLDIYRHEAKPMGLRTWLRLFPAALRQSLAQRMRGSSR